jgi:hypothetical protein
MTDEGLLRQSDEMMCVLMRNRYDRQTSNKNAPKEQGEGTFRSGVESKISI